MLSTRPTPSSFRTVMRYVFSPINSAFRVFLPLKMPKPEKGHHPSANLRQGGKNIVSPSTLNFAVRGDKHRIYTLYNPPELAPPGG